MDIVIDFGWLEAAALTVVRITLFVIIAPPFSYAVFPARIKAIVAVGLGVAVSAHTAEGHHVMDTGGFILALVLEAATGAILGFFVYLVFAAIQSAGNLVDTFGGFQVAQAFDPQSAVTGAQFTRLYQMLALAILFASDGYQIVIGGVMRSFDAIPLGTAFDLGVDIHAMSASFTQMILAALQIAGPLMVVFFLADLGLGLLTRVAPALNAFAMGFPLKIMLSLSLGGLVLTSFPQLVGTLAQTSVEHLLGVG